jgi:hypothetical protein
MTKKLQTLLYVIAAYLAAFGLLFLLAPNAAEQFTKSIHDPGLSLLYGQYSLTFAFVAFLAAREKEAASKLSLAVLVLLAGHVLIFGYELLSGRQAFAQAGPPVIVNAILVVILLLFRKERAV